MARQLVTIEDYTKEFYGSPYTLQKDSPVLSSTNYVHNIIYGEKLWSQIVTEANVFGLLPKKPWDHSGYRVITTAATSSGIGVSEGSAIPATLKPTFLEIDVECKEQATSFDESKRLLNLAGKDDVILWADLQEHMADEFANSMNADLCGNVTTVAGNNIESIDRVCSSYSEVTNCADVNAEDSDIYGVDRDADQTWNNAYVSHGSDTDRTFATSQVDEVLTNCRPFWKNPASVENKVFVTGYDTQARWSRIMQVQQRYDTTKVKFTINGIESVGDNEAGFTISAYNGIPIVCSNNIVQDTLSRIYLLDLDHVHIGVLEPTMYMESEDAQLLDKFVREGVFYSQMELVANKFRCHGKVRDLK